MADRVLLTGISGFLGGHVALALLNAGYGVRGSVRNLSKADKVRATLAKAGADIARLEFVALDLESDAGWAEAAAGCRYVQHTASPFVLKMPRDKAELVGPAVAGTERALNAALQAGVARIVLTSSMAAMAYGHGSQRTTPFTGADWTNLESSGINAYVESKTRAERRAWEIMRAAGREEDLVAINPSAIFGPLLDEDPGTSATLIQRLMNGSVPALPRIPITVVDVRDVAEAHVTAMTAPEAGGNRFPMGAEGLFFRQIADIVRQRYSDRRIAKLEMPDWAVRLYGLFDRDVRDNIGELGTPKYLDATAVEHLLGHKLIDAREAILATADSLVREGLV